MTTEVLLIQKINTYVCVSSLAEKMLILGNRSLELGQMNPYERKLCSETRPRGEEEQVCLTLLNEDLVCK